MHTYFQEWLSHLVSKDSRFYHFSKMSRLYLTEKRWNQIPHIVSPICFEVELTFTTPIQILVAIDSFFFLDLFIQGSNRFLSPATLLWMELLSVKNHNVFPNESDYFINAHQGSFLCRGISNLLLCLLQFWNHCWRQELLCVFQGPKLQSFLLHTIGLRISGWLLRSFEMDGNFQVFLSSDFVQIY